LSLESEVTNIIREKGVSKAMELIKEVASLVVDRVQVDLIDTICDKLQVSIDSATNSVLIKTKSVHESHVQSLISKYVSLAITNTEAITSSFVNVDAGEGCSHSTTVTSQGNVRGICINNIIKRLYIQLGLQNSSTLTGK
jgi:hypothetical protein